MTNTAHLKEELLQSTPNIQEKSNATLQQCNFKYVCAINGHDTFLLSAFFFKALFFFCSHDPITQQSITEKEFKQTSRRANKGAAGKPCRQGFHNSLS